MAFCELRYRSAALEKQVAANVILPEGKGDGPFPVFYLLHGLSDDHTMWSRNTSLERYAAAYPMIVVMPDGGRSFYCDAAQGFAYETAIVGDLVGTVDRLFQTRRGRAGRAIGGLSMGGYGALKLALRFPEMFCSATSHSGAVHFGHDFWHDRSEFARIVGEPVCGGPNDLYRIAEEHASGKRSPLPALRIDCGADDFLSEDNRAFHAHLEKLGLAHEYAEFPGAHTWDYWDARVQEALAFHARNLGIEKAAV